jgi:SAM-dependent methyltransferase
VLELGCGEGTAALRLASWGAHVRAVDISPSRVEAAQRAAAAEAVPGSVSFEVMNAEKLVFGDDEFDLVCGQAILHHLDLERTFAEVVRTLKPDGRAVFIEPLGHNPLINLYRSLTPALRTPDERPLVARDLELAGRYFADARFQFFHLTSFAAVPFVRFAWFQTLARRLEALDYRVLRRFPSLGKYAWRVVLDLAAPQQGAQLDPDQASPTSASI